MSENQATLEHVNFTVPDANETAAMLCKLFGWKIRWQGPALNGGLSIHVGGDDNYLAVYSPAEGAGVADINKMRAGHLNHVGIVVIDLAAVEKKVKALGYEPYNHADYEPGQRFYFDDENGIEFEVVSYD
ncbi:VOC family protein [Ahrensia marina]|uniref:Glyoxalase n=1 Tax=Ahrensia marina TaxID=1514904 RepID=A0A0M9GPY9_9HYPH|nr:VOC family protein [Ahrensia marina]KPB02963.1 glyoxalase [Ahrensia marina]